MGTGAVYERIGVVCQRPSMRQIPAPVFTVPLSAEEEMMAKNTLFSSTFFWRTLVRNLNTIVEICQDGSLFHCSNIVSSPPSLSLLSEQSLSISTSQPRPYQPDSHQHSQSPPPDPPPPPLDMPVAVLHWPWPWQLPGQPSREQCLPFQPAREEETQCFTLSNRQNLSNFPFEYKLYSK